MPTDISNKLGTQRQFTPQPDRQYQGRYQNVGASSVSPTVSNTDILAQNVQLLDRALQNYLVSHEKYLNDTGLVQAERLMSSMSPADKEKLNVIDGAIQAGYVDDTANPYFKAYAEKLRGSFLGARVKEEYDKEYSMNPARSMEEEQQRYYDFVSNWKETHLSGDNAPVNMVAFDSGFNENQAVNQLKLADSWNTKKHQEDIIVTMASAQSKLGGIIENSVDLLKTNGAMTDAVQEVFNEMRLMGLPPEYRQKLLEDFSTQLIQTGHLDATRFEQMMDNITVQTSIDGITTKASDILNMQTFKTYSVNFQAQFMDKWKYDTIKDFIEKGDTNAVLNAQKWVAENDPDKLPIWQEITAKSLAGIEQKKREREQALKEQLKERQKQLAQNMKDNMTYGAINTWANGGDTYNGRPISAVDIDKDTMYPIIMPMLQEAMQNGDLKKVDRLMRFPKADQIRNDISDNLSYNLDNIRLNSDGSVPTLDDTTKNFLNFYITNANSATHIFGKELGNRVNVLKTFFNLYNGDLSSAVKMFATYNSTDNETKSATKDQLVSYINQTGSKVQALPLLGDDNVLGDSGTVPAYLTGDASLMADVTTLATAFKIQGMTNQQAVNTACQIIQDNYVQYKGSIFPKSLYNGIRSYTTDKDDRVYFTRALESVRKEVSESYTEDVKVAYDDNTQTFYFTHPYSPEYSTAKSLGEIRRIAGDNFDSDLQWLQQHQESEESLNIDEINEQRQYASWDTGYQKEVENKVKYPIITNLGGWH